MKKAITWLLSLALGLSLTACGGGILTEEQIAEAEKWGMLAGDGSYESYDHIEGVLAVVPTGDKTFAEALEDAVGDLEYYSAKDTAPCLKAILFENDGSGIADRVQIVGKKSDGSKDSDSQSEGGSDEGAVLRYKFSGGSDASPDESFSQGSIEYNGTTIALEDKGSFSDNVKWLLAAKSLEMDNWAAGQGQALTDALAVEKAKKDTVKGEWTESAEYFALCRSNAVYKQYREKQGLVEYLENLTAALEKASEGEYSDIYEKALRNNEFQFKLAALMDQKAAVDAGTPALEANAKPILDNLSADIAALEKKSKNYKDSEAYLRIKAQNPAVAAYEDNLSASSRLNKKIEILKKAYETEDRDLRSILLDSSEKEAEYSLNYEQARMAYIQAVLALESYKAANQAELKAYNDTLDAVKKKNGGKGYEADVDYMKNELAHQNLTANLATYESAVKNAEEKADQLKKTMKETRKEISEKEEAREKAILREKDDKKIRVFLDELVKGIGELNVGDPKEKTTVLGEISGFAVVQMSSSAVDSLDSARDIIYHKSYTNNNSNKYKNNSDDGGIKYDPNDDYYRENDHNHDGKINDEEFQDALGDYMDDLMGY